VQNRLFFQKLTTAKVKFLDW